MNIARIRKSAADFGWPAALQAVAQGAVNHVALFRVLKCLRVSEVDARFLELDRRFEHRFLDTDALLGFSAVAKYDLPRSFLDQALAKGDQCYGILDGDRLASFGWYSTVPTMVSDDLRLRFDARHVYMYKGFTDPDYRGQRLHAIGMSWALKLYRERGSQGLVSYVDANNFDSLRSCARMGFQTVGQIYFMRTAGRYWIHTDAACRAFGLSLEGA